MYINYKDLGLSVDKSRSTFEFNGIEIDIVNYLPLRDKYDLIMIALQKSYEDYYYNDIKLDMYFHLNILYSYTNIVFDKDDRADEENLYNEIVSSGLLESFLGAFSEEEYAELQKLLRALAKNMIEAKRSFGFTVQNAITMLPENMEKTIDALKNIDPEQFKILADLNKDLVEGNPIIHK